jgi:Xaa-Pro aminopeptidase
VNTAVLELMARHDVDALILGREANTRAVAGTRRLWLAGTRAFSPSCVVVRKPAGTYVLANNDDLVPRDIPVDHLYGITWNPENMSAALRAIAGLSSARRIAVDGMTPLTYTLLRGIVADATFVDAAPILADLAATVPPAEREAGVRAAVEVVSAGLAAIVDALRPGVLPRTLRGIGAEAFAAFGVTTPAFEAVVAPLNGGTGSWLAPERVLDAGDEVVVRVGALRDGWEASVARTLLVDNGAPKPRPDPPRWDPLLHACTAGTTVGTLRSRGAVLYGVGRGVEPWDDDVTLAAGMTGALEVSGPLCIRQDVVRITDAAPALLT